MKTYHVGHGRVVTFHALCDSLVIVRTGRGKQSRFEMLDGDTLKVDASTEPVTEAIVEVRVGLVMTRNELTKHEIVLRLTSGLYGRIRSRWERYAEAIAKAEGR